MKRLGRKFGVAVFFCAPLCVAATLAFCLLIKEPNAPLLLSMVAAPCLLIVAGSVGLEGARDIKVAERKE